MSKTEIFINGRWEELPLKPRLGMNEPIYDWYIRTYPDRRPLMDRDLTFSDLFKYMLEEKDIRRYILDYTTRTHCFARIAELTGMDIEFVFAIWKMGARYFE